MFHAIAGALIVLWLLAPVTGNTLGSFIHGLLVLAVVVVLFNFISGRRKSHWKGVSIRERARAGVGSDRSPRTIVFVS
jgi:hypothetical protein